MKILCIGVAGSTGPSVAHCGRKDYKSEQRIIAPPDPK